MSGATPARAATQTHGVIVLANPSGISDPPASDRCVPRSPGFEGIDGYWVAATAGTPFSLEWDGRAKGVSLPDIQSDGPDTDIEFFDATCPVLPMQRFANAGNEYGTVPAGATAGFVTFFNATLIDIGFVYTN